MEIWLNPACSKCRVAVADLDAAGVDYTVRRYLDDPPTRAELEDVLAALGLEPWDIARDKEAAEEGRRSRATPTTATTGSTASPSTRAPSSGRSSPRPTAPPWSAATRAQSSSRSLTSRARLPRLLRVDPLALVFSSGWASGVNCYLVVLVLGIADRVHDTPRSPTCSAGGTCWPSPGSSTRWSSSPTRSPTSTPRGTRLDVHPADRRAP